MRELLIASSAFALFVICPRMAGMTNVIAGATHLSIIRIAVLGTVLALPPIILMALIFKEYGLFAALLFGVVTDLMAAVVMKGISFKAGVETLIIASFVILGVKVASMVSAWMS